MVNYTADIHYKCGCIYRDINTTRNCKHRKVNGVCNESHKDGDVLKDKKCARCETKDGVPRLEDETMSKEQKRLEEQASLEAQASQARSAAHGRVEQQLRWAQIGQQPQTDQQIRADIYDPEWIDKAAAGTREWISENGYQQSRD